MCLRLCSYLASLGAVAFHLDSDRPDEAQQFTSHGGHNFPLIFAGAHQRAITLMEPVLRLPCAFFDFLAEPLLALAESGSDSGSVSVGPGRLHYHPAQVGCRTKHTKPC